MSKKKKVYFQDKNPYNPYNFRFTKKNPYNPYIRLRYHKAKHKKNLLMKLLHPDFKVDIEHPLKLKINNQTYVYKH